MQPHAQPHKSAPSPEIHSLIQEVRQIDRRLRMLEERYTNVIRKTQVTDQNMLQSHKKIHVEMKAAESEVTELHRKINVLQETVGLAIQEIKDCARKQEIDVLKKYLELWQPVKFVTQNQVERIVEDVLEHRSLGRAQRSNEPAERQNTSIAPEQ
jgi:hypothetical protein